MKWHIDCNSIELRNFCKMSKTLNCFYDFTTCPSSFDIITYLMSAEITRIRRNLDSLSIFIFKGPIHGFRFDNKNKNVDENNMYLQNVILPSLQLLPSIKEISWCEKKDFQLKYIEPGNIFPRGYDIYRPILGHKSISGKEFVPARLLNNQPGWFKAPSYAVNLALNYLRSHFGEKPVITLSSREAEDFDINKTRRINLKSWEKIFEKCLSIGIQPLIIRETEKAFDNNPFYKNIPEIPIASLHLPFRTALYEKCFLNFFTINGPGALAMFGLNNSCHLYKFDEESDVVSSNFHKKRFGMSEGSSLPMTTKSSKFLWNTQKSNDILKIINKVRENQFISDELNDFSCNKNINFSVSTSLECLLVDLCSGFVLKEDIDLISSIHNLYKKKIIDIDPFESIRNIEKKFNYGNKTLPSNITDKIYALYKKTNLNTSLAS